MDKIKLDAMRYGVSNEFMRALHAFVDGFNEAQQTHPTERQIDELADIDSAKDQEIADLKRQLAAAQNDVKQLRQSRDKRNGKAKQKTSGTWFAPIASMDVRFGVLDSGKSTVTEDGVDRPGGTPVDSQKPSQMLGFLDELAKCAKAMEQAAGEAVKALSRMAENTELIKVESVSVVSKSCPSASNGTAAYPKGAWIDWHGGECPVKTNDAVLVRLKNGDTGKEKARYLRWDKRGLDGDIIAFMIL